MKLKKFLSFVLCAVIIFTAMPFCATAQEYTGDFAEGEAVFEYTQSVENEKDFLNNSNIPEELAQIGITSVRELTVDKIFDTSIKENADGTKTKSGYYVGYFDGEVEAVCSKLNGLSAVSYASPSFLMQEDAVTIPSEVTSPRSLYNTYTK